MSWLKIAWRHHRASRLYTILNLSGLAVGVAVALLIGLWVHDELAFDTIHPNHDRIARVMDNQPVEGGINTTGEVPVPLAAELRNRYGADFTRIALYYPNFRHILTVDEGTGRSPSGPGSSLQVLPLAKGSGSGQEQPQAARPKANHEPNGVHGTPAIPNASRKSVAQIGSWVQPDLPVMLSLPMITGNRQALIDRSNALISLSLSHALFGSADPMGRTIRVDNNVDVRVGGVFADIPAGSSFHEVNIFLPWDKAVDEMPWMKDYTNAWDAAGFNIYVQLSEKADIARINKNIRDIMAAHTHNKGETLFLQPMRQWHLYGEFSNGVVSGGRIRIVRLFAGIGIFVLLLACINFMNLATARSSSRAKEVGIRKTLGSPKAQLIARFLGEATMMTLVAAILALGIALLALPFFNRLAGKTLFIPWTEPAFIALILAFIGITALLAGSYPAFYLSRFKPVRVLKGDLRSGPLASLPRKILVVLQFTISISLIIGTILVGRQIAYAKDRPVGYTRAGLINIGKNTKDLYDASYQQLRADLIRTGMVTNMAEAALPVTELPAAATNTLEWEGSDPNAKPAFTGLAVTADFGRTLGWQIIAGRDFDPALKTDSNSLIINETAAKLIGFPQPIGKQLRIGGAQRYTIIGVVTPLVMNSPFQRVLPGYYFIAPDKQVNDILIRIQPGRPAHVALAAIETVLRKYNPESPFDYRFVDTDYAQKFADEERVAALAGVLTVLAIFISCLGLFGLAAFTAEQRTKEIGVRKVLGSSAFRIWRLLTAEILRLVALSGGIAIPLTALFMHKWLMGYTWRISMGWEVFILSAGMALVVAVATVSYHAVRAAFTNPVQSLRSE